MMHKVRGKKKESKSKKKWVQSNQQNGLNEFHWTPFQRNPACFASFSLLFQGSSLAKLNSMCFAFYFLKQAPTHSEHSKAKKETRNNLKLSWSWQVTAHSVLHRLRWLGNVQINKKDQKNKETREARTETENRSICCIWRLCTKIFTTETTHTQLQEE